MSAGSALGQPGAGLFVRLAWRTVCLALRQRPFRAVPRGSAFMDPKSVDRLLPSMRCDDGCGECCGPVVCSQPEYDAVLAYAAEHGVEPVDQGVTCPWFQGGRCAVHEARPTTCRLYGHVDGMRCPRGYNANVTLTVERRLVRTCATRSAAPRRGFFTRRSSPSKPWRRGSGRSSSRTPPRPGRPQTSRITGRRR